MRGYLQRLELDQKYVISVELKTGYVLTSVATFVKTTEKGFNFYFQDQDKLIFKNHLYPFKKAYRKNSFFLPWVVTVKPTT